MTPDARAGRRRPALPLVSLLPQFLPGRRPVTPTTQPDRSPPRWPLVVPPLALYLCDATITLLHQTPGYWAGRFDEVREGNPFFREMLVRHPAIFLAFIVAWGVAFSVILLRWRHPLAKVMAFLLTLGHAVGTGSWLIGHGAIGWAAALALLVASERLLEWSWRKSAPVRSRAPDG